MTPRYLSVFALLLASASLAIAGRGSLEEFLKLPSEGDTAFPGTKWALLIAGSSGYGNYRHQADICHAYQLLRKNGLQEENIVVFMADDIAHNPENPYPGTLINKPDGDDVYAGVPKDYTGHNVTVNNFLAALKGDRSAVLGGSGKVVASGPDDHVFVYYSDHGGPGILGMPTLPFLFADDIVNALKAKHAAKGYKELVFYLEACESGSIFEGMLPMNIHVYATTASNSMESSWGTYCPGMEPAPPAEFETCLGDLYSVAWMEDSDVHNLAKETLHDQYLIVKERTSNHATYESGSHVMQYGDLAIHTQLASHYLGTDPANENAPPAIVPDFGDTPVVPTMGEGQRLFYSGERAGAVSQRDAELLHLWHKYHKAAEGSPRKSQALEEMSRVSAERSHVDRSVTLISKLLLGSPVSAADKVPSSSESGAERSWSRRPEGLPLVDDWGCLKAMVRSYESQCGRLTQYGMKHTRVFASLCNAGIGPEKLTEAAGEACAGTTRHLSLGGAFSA